MEKDISEGINECYVHISVSSTYIISFACQSRAYDMSLENSVNKEINHSSSTRILTLDK